MREIDSFNQEISESVETLTKIKSAESVLAFGINLARENNLLPVATTSGGEYSAILMDLLVSQSPETPVVFVDMGPACYTQSTRFGMIAEFFKMGLPIKTYFSKIAAPDMPPTKPELDYIYGTEWRDPASVMYSEVMRELKIVPCYEAIQKMIDESYTDGVLLVRGTRQDANIASRDSINWLGKHGRGVVLHPIADWTKDDAETYISSKKLPKNLNHTDPSRGRVNENGVVTVAYPDGTVYDASHTVCVLDNASEGHI